MRALRLLLLSALFATPAFGQSVTCTDGTTSTATGRGACSGHGGVAPSKVSAAKPAKASPSTMAKPATPPVAAVPAAAGQVKCTDGTMSAATGRGACSKHGGVAPVTAAPVAPTAAVKPAKVSTSAMPAPVTPAAPASKAPTVASATAPASASAQCNDGSFSQTAHRRGACSSHGGVKTWLKTVAP